MKQLFVLLVFSFIFFSSCKKDKTISNDQQTSGSLNSEPFVIDSVPEKIGYQKIFNVIVREIYTPTVTGVTTTNTLSTFNMTFNIVADTALPNNVTGKKYVVTSTNSVVPVIYAYSYYNSVDSTWEFKRLNYSKYVPEMSLKLPLKAGQTWTMATTSPNYGDNLKNDGEEYVLVNNLNVLSFKIEGRSKSMTNFQTYNYIYNMTKKGLAWHVFNDIFISNPAYSWQMNQTEINMLSCNF